MKKMQGLLSLWRYICKGISSIFGKNRKEAKKLAIAFYEMAETYLQEGKDEKALVYFNRFDELVGSDDNLYEQFEYKDEQASKWIAELSEKNSYVNELKAWVKESGQELDEFQKIQWNLLTLARMNKLFTEFSKLSGFEVFKDFEKMIDMLTKGLYFGCDDEEEELVDDMLIDLEDIETSAMVSRKSRVAIKNNADFEAFDLVGDDLYMNMTLFLYEIVDYLEGTEDEGIKLDFVTNALHIGYYVRTREESLYEIEALKEEKNRIIADYDFIKGKPGNAEFVKRMAEYKELLLPKMQ